MNISLGADGAFALTLPSGRVLSIPNTPHASAFLFSILWDEGHGAPERKGYIGVYPTQAAADAWLRNAARERRDGALERLGIENLGFEI